jgi:hypothetical protein
MKNFQNKDRIINVSRRLCTLARGTLAVWFIGLAIFLFEVIATATRGGNARAIYLTSSGVIEMLCALTVTWRFLQFFTRLGKGALFDAPTVGSLHAAGRWWLVASFCDLAFGIIGNTWLDTRVTVAFGELLPALIVIFFAWLLEEAQGLQEEQALTV